MDPKLYSGLLRQCAEMGVSAIKLNYRGEPSLHPEIVSFVRQAAERLSGHHDEHERNGGARTRPELFAALEEPASPLHVLGQHRR